MSGIGKDAVNEFGDGVAWIRGPIIGKGSFGRVYKATLKKPISKYSCFPSVMAIKSAEVSCSGTIQKEKEVLSNLSGSPYLIECFGEELTMGENGVMAYNLLLEYGSGGTLADRIEKSGSNGLPELEARLHTMSILRGLNHIHGTGYVHCDLKPDNILLVPKDGTFGKMTEFRAKIGDFGLAKRQKVSKKRKLEPYWRGTPMYLSPESVIDSVQEAPSDVWSVGCIVLEMLTGKPAWHEKNAEDILAKIGAINELPKVPDELSKDARDFLKRCFVRKSMYRFTCEMLLNHPFVEGLNIDDDDDGVEDLEDFECLNETKSVALVSTSDDEFLFSDECSDESEEDSFSYWSDEGAQYMHFDEHLSSLAEERESGVVESAVVFSSSADAGFDQSNETSKLIFPQSVSKRRRHCRVSISISAAI